MTEFNRSDIRRMFGMVLQDTWLFNGTIKDNIKYGKLDATDPEVKEACHTASVDHFIKTLPDGYNMVLNEEADNVSGGQKQLLTIARVILADPKILILDEPTTGLHSADIKKLLVILQRIVDNGDTVVVIEHNLDVIKVADYIIDLGPEGGSGGGTIIATGTPEEIAKNETSYTGQYLKKYLK